MHIENESPFKGNLDQKSAKNPLISEIKIKEQEDDRNCFFRYYEGMKKFY